MKKVFIIISVLLSALSVVCFAQGSVNSNNASGTPSGETRDPYSKELSDYTTMTDSMTVTDTALTDAATAPTYNSDPTSQETRDMTAAIIVIAVLVMITVAAVVAFVMMKRREDN